MSKLVDQGLLLAEGDRIPADTLLLETSGMLADESLLTGDTVPYSVLRPASDLLVGWPQSSPCTPP